ncbi:hypothetical protein JCM8547_007109 [Rhodosporidiobolus lusitaniae]
MSALPTAGAPAASTTATGASVSNPAAAGNTSQGDALDKGVDGVLKHFGKGQSRGTTEKISDGIRSLFKKATGKDVPIKDQN